jgi:hypothetical protein
MGTVAGKERLIGEQKDTIHQVPVERPELTKHPFWYA